MARFCQHITGCGPRRRLLSTLRPLPTFQFCYVRPAVARLVSIRYATLIFLTFFFFFLFFFNPLLVYCNPECGLLFLPAITAPSIVRVASSRSKCALTPPTSGLAVKAVTYLPHAVFFSSFFPPGYPCVPFQTKHAGVSLGRRLKRDLANFVITIIAHPDQVLLVQYLWGGKVSSTKLARVTPPISLPTSQPFQSKAKAPGRSAPQPHYPPSCICRGRPFGLLTYHICLLPAHPRISNRLPSPSTHHPEEVPRVWRQRGIQATAQRVPN